MPDEVNEEFETWRRQRIPAGVRRGQHLMNTAPAHIYTFASHRPLLDCFHEENPYGPLTTNFVMFTELVWDEKRHNQMRKAVQTVLAD